MQAEYAALRKLNTEQSELSETEIKLKMYRAIGMLAIDDLQPSLAPTEEAEGNVLDFGKPIRVRLRNL